jgi:hypothetical protein
MSYSVYLESSIVDLKPRVLDFLTTLVDKAKEVKDYAISMKKKEMADLIGKDTRTISRYLNELESKNIIETKGKKGRAGGTIILFNTDLVRFDTSDKALVNSDNPKSIDEIMESKMPKKRKPTPTRNRRTKQQMLEAELLQNEKQKVMTAMNNKIEKLGGAPNWDWFKETENPVDNYRTYLLSRLYNRYAVLFTDKHNSDVLGSGEGNEVPRVSNDYDVLPMEFYGTARWNQFENLRKFCEDNDIEPAAYLSAQFSRSIFDSSRKSNKKMLPFVNALTGDTSYEVYKQYCSYQKKASHTYAAYQVVPSRFKEDFVVRAIVEAYDTANEGIGFLELRHAISDFLEGLGSSAEEEALLGFFRLTDKGLRDNNVSLESRNTLKKYVMLQSLIQTGGARNIPKSTILGAEMTRAVLVSIDNQIQDRDKAREVKAHALGVLVHPYLRREEQIKKGQTYLYQYDVLHETPQILKLIMERKNLHIGVMEISNALKEYGKEKIPVDDYSILDVTQVIKFMETEVFKTKEPEEFRHEDMINKENKLTGSIGAADPLADSFDNFLNELED